MKKNYLAIDIGASSGRHILGSVQNGKIVLEEVYRFDNKQVHQNGHDCWDMNNLWNGILDGLKACKTLGKIPVTIGIDTWAVDHVLLDKEGRQIGDAVAYRDGRTEGMDDVVSDLIPPEFLYSRTGIQKQIFNTIYQLMALRVQNPEQLNTADSLLMIPDYFHYRLTGVKTQEYTNATSTNLVNAHSKEWDMALIGKLALPQKLFTPLSMPGTVVGELTAEIQQEVGFNAKVILPATHDTGSAFLAVPARDDKAVYLSSGTWSLLGVENEVPITTEASRLQNFTNEGGAWYRFRYLKNIMGLWMIQSIRRELNGVEYVAGKASKYATGRTWSFPDLIDAARNSADFPSVVDANDESFLAPDSMIDAIKTYCAKTDQPVPVTVGEIMQCVYKSLSKCYKDAIEGLSQLTGKTYTSINIVGGGCQDMYLNQMTADATGLPVYADPVEGTAIGNLIVQMIAAQEFDSLQAARDAIDFERKTISISHKVIEANVDGKYVPVGEDVLKTKSSFRTLPLIPVVEELLLAEKEKQAKNRRLFKSAYCRDDLSYICVDEMGKLLRPNFVTEHFGWVIRKYGLRKIRFHDLRHTCASLLLSNGIPMKQIQIWLGHSTFSTTADIYAHLDFSAQEQSAAAMSAMFQRKEVSAG